MREWKPVLIPLDKGLGQDSADSVGVSFQRVVNCDFGKKGAVRGRPGYLRATGGFWMTGQNAGVPTQTNVANLAATGYTPQALSSITDKRTERPLLVTNGRYYSYEGDAWVDRLGAGSCRVDRVTDYVPAITNNNQPGAIVPPAVGYDFGPMPQFNGSGAYVFGTGDVLLAGSGERDVTVPGNTQGPGSCAMVTAGGHTYSANVQVSTGGNSLYISLRTDSGRTLSNQFLANDAATPLGYGDVPCICPGLDATGNAVFLVLYKTTTAHQVKILGISTAGAVTSTTSVSYGSGTIVGLWVSSNILDLALGHFYTVIALVDTATTGVKTKVYADGVDAAIDVQMGNAVQGWGPVTVGAGKINNAVGGIWLTYLDNTGQLQIQRRSLTAASQTTYAVFPGQFYNPGGNSTTIGHGWFLQHQPILVQGRAIAGFALNRAWSSALAGHITATWYCCDLTDLETQGVGTTGSRWSPTLIARGDLDGSAIPWQPVTAVVGTDGNSWRFATLDWTSFLPGDLNGGLALQTQSSPPNVGTANVQGIAIAGYDASLGVNEVSFQPPQVAHIGNSTIIGGSIPRAISGGAAYEVGFPWIGFPAITAVPSSTGGSWAVGSYTAACCWKWTDEFGQVHRSAPSARYTFTIASGQKLNLNGTPYLFTDRDAQNVGDRGGVYLEFYISDVSPAYGAVLYLVDTVACEQPAGAMQISHNLLGPTDKTQLPLYTFSQTMPEAHMPVSGDGGVATVGQRCFMSDGDFVYASLLGQDGDPPAWAGESDLRSGGASGPLTLSIPPGAGRILALSSLDDKLVIHCERGTYAMAGNGPDDTGANSDYTEPFLVSPLGLTGPRAVVSTPRGVVFHAAHQAPGESLQGGLWLLDKQLQSALISWPARDAVASDQAGEMAFLPERGLVVYLAPNFSGTIPGAPPNYSSGGGGGSAGGVFPAATPGPFLVIWDMHAGEGTGTWAIWTAPPDGLASITSVAGYLWSVGTDVGGFTRLPGIGHDTAAGVDTNFSMEIQTNELASTGEDQLGWSRIRSLRVQGDAGGTNHNLVLAYVLDDAIANNAFLAATKTIAVVAQQGQTTGWPSDRYCPEWRIAQKASTIQVDMVANPAVATWTRLELQVKPAPVRSLSHNAN